MALGKYYDPSYGSGPFLTPLEWENHSVDGYGKWIIQGNFSFRGIKKKTNPNETEVIFF
jgi:hypothetical protein